MKNSIISSQENQQKKQTENNIERSGVAQVKSRRINTEVPKSEIIIGGVELYGD